ncbi:DUF6602 domain-containing protein [Bremerella sp. T1]
MLLRDYFRRVLLPWMGVDKGFIYGRTADDHGAESSPEIDILIHDQQTYRPIFRMDDFVIVQPESVLGIIQVKKRLNTLGRSNPLREGLCNVVTAKRHVLTQLRRRHASHSLLERRCGRIVGAVIGFDGRTLARTYWRYLNREFMNHSEFIQQFVHNVQGNVYAMPHFVGSLSGHFCLRSRFNRDQLTYRCFPSSFEGHNVSAQMLADISASLIWGSPLDRDSSPPFQYPEGFRHESEHIVRNEESAD